MNLSTELVIPTSTPEAKFSPVQRKEADEVSTVRQTTTIEETSTQTITKTYTRGQSTKTVTKTVVFAGKTTDTLES